MTTAMIEYTLFIAAPDAPLADVVEAVKERAANTPDGWVSNSALQISGVHGTAIDRARKAGVLEERYTRLGARFEYRVAS